jgi:hypothetical protein
VNGAVFVIVTAGAFIFGFAGFGMALIVIPATCLFWPLEQAVALQVSIGVFITAYHAVLYGRRANWRRFLPMIIGSALAMPVGLLLLKSVPETILKRGLGVFIILAVLGMRYGLTPSISARLAGSNRWALGWGSLSGLCQGLFALAGPPAAIYLRAAEPDPRAIKGFMGGYLFFVTVFSLAMFGAGGIITPGRLLFVLPYVPAVFLGLFLGAVVFKRVSVPTYRTAVDVLLIATASLLFFRA